MTTTESQGSDPSSRPAGSRPAEVVRSEEQLRVGTRTEVTGRVRVRKVVTSHEVTQTFTVRREELVVEHLPAEGGPAASPTPAGEPGAEDLELVLHEEQVMVVSVPVERVRVRVERVQEDRQITEVVRREQVGLSVQAVDPSPPRG